MESFLRLFAGMGSGSPRSREDEPSERQGPPNRGLWQRLRDNVPRSGQGKTEGRLAGEQEKRRPAESGPGQRPDGAAPAPGQTHALPEPDLSVSKRQVFRSLVSPLKPGRMLDLGAGPGKFAMDAARLGWKVTAVDARTTRTPDPEEQGDPERAGLIRSIDWIAADVREFPIRGGEYDLICILGLLHHLEVDDQVALLRRCSDTLTLLTVRVAPEAEVSEGPYEGRHRREQGETREERDGIPTASWGNEVSFWHTEESLLRMMRDCGYSKVMPMRPPFRKGYTFYLCLPTPTG